MTRKDTMVHCHLVRNSNIHYHCWLPAKFAKKDKMLSLIMEGGHETHGWVVLEVFNELPTAVVLERSQDYKRTRKASDI